MTLDELAKRCKGDVHVTFNDHRSDYETTTKALEDEWFKEVTPEMRARMIAEDQVVQVQFYPRTPISFGVVFGTTLEECMSQIDEGDLDP